MVIGGVWVPEIVEDKYRIAIWKIKKAYGVNWEFKWSRLNPHRTEAYKELVDVFFDAPSLSYRCILVDKTLIDYATYHNNDKELGFYKFYFQLLSRSLNPNIAYWAYLDDRTNKKANRLPDLKATVNQWCKRRHRCRDELLRTVEARDSRSHELIQMTDVLTGAIAGIWNEEFRNQAKYDICGHIAMRKNWSTLKVSTFPSENKFNIWKWEPKKIERPDS